MKNEKNESKDEFDNDSVPTEVIDLSHLSNEEAEKALEEDIDRRLQKIEDEYFND
jgi:RNA polymerase-binding transcription factor DksA